MIQNDDILKPPYAEWDVYDLPEDQWWHEFSIEKALKIIEIDSICPRNLFNNPTIVAVEQLIKYVLFSEKPEETQMAEKKLINLLKKNLVYKWVIASACRHLVGMDIDIRKFMHDKADYFINMLNSGYPFKVNGQMDENRKKDHLELKPVLISTILGFTDDPKVLPILVEWVRSDNLELSTEAFHAIIIDSRLDYRFSTGESLYNQVNKFDRRKFIEEVSKSKNFKKILSNLKQKEADGELLNLINRLLGEG